MADGANKPRIEEREKAKGKRLNRGEDSGVEFVALEERSFLYLIRLEPLSHLG